MDSIKKTKSEIARRLWRNINDALLVAGKVDSKTLVLIVFLSLLGATFPILSAYILKIFLDKLILDISMLGVVSASLLGIFSFRYILQFIEYFSSAFQYQYLGRIFRYKFENYLTLEFSKKMSELDIAHFEDSETQNLIIKARQSYSSRIHDFVKNIIFFGTSLGTFIGAFIVLLPLGFWMPIIMTLAVLPRFWLRSKYSKVSWSVFNQKIPESKELIYISDLLDDPASVKELRIFQAASALTSKMEKLQNYIFA